MAVEQHEGKMHVNGVDLSYVEAGKGRPVVLVHGYFSDYRSWRNQLEFFGKNYRTIAYSLRYNFPHKGHVDGSDRAQQDHTDDLAGLIEKLDLKPCYIVGSSYGGVVALRLARWRPELVRALVLGEPGLLSWLLEIPGGASILNDLERLFAAPARKAMRYGDLDRALRFVTDGAVGPGLYDKLPEASRRAFMDNAHLITSLNFQDMFSREDARSIQIPTLLLEGERSPKMYGLIVDELARCLPIVDRGTITGAMHMLHSFNPTLYNDTVFSFLSRH